MTQKSLPQNTQTLTQRKPLMVTLTMIHGTREGRGGDAPLLRSRTYFLQQHFQRQSRWVTLALRSHKQVTASDKVRLCVIYQECVQLIQDGMWNEFCEICAVLLQLAGRGEQGKGRAWFGTGLLDLCSGGRLMA